jgi:hypothetical protein
MTGKFQGFELTFGSFGQQYATIDGNRYVTCFDLTDPNIRGLKPGVRVEFETFQGPTKLCDEPRVMQKLPMAKLLRTIREN